MCASQPEMPFRVAIVSSTRWESLRRAFAAPLWIAEMRFCTKDGYTTYLREVGQTADVMSAGNYEPCRCDGVGILMASFPLLEVHCIHLRPVDTLRAGPCLISTPFEFQLPGAENNRGVTGNLGQWVEGGSTRLTRAGNQPRFVQRGASHLRRRSVQPSRIGDPQPPPTVAALFHDLCSSAAFFVIATVR